MVLCTLPAYYSFSVNLEQLSGKPLSSLRQCLQWHLGMKFGKRLASEASRRWRPFYLDYKTVKRAIQHDVRARGLTSTALTAQEAVTVCMLCMQHLMNATCSPADPFGAQFAEAIQQELERINAFYSEQEQQLEVVTKLASQHELLVFAMVFNPQPRHFDSPMAAGCIGRPSARWPDIVRSTPF